jgi:hypothetical protein
MVDQSSLLCDDCGVETWPWEIYVVHGEIWREAGADPKGILCLGCLENRLGRELEPPDFPRLPINDDEEVDSIRLREAKGSGRCAHHLFEIAVEAVLAGADAGMVAERLKLAPDVLAVWVKGARMKEEL